MSVTLDQDMIIRALNDNFMNQVQVITSLYAKYNPHMLGLLEEADYNQRIRRLQIVVKVYTEQIIECASTMRDIEETKRKLEELKEYRVEEYTNEDNEKKKRKVFIGYSDPNKADIYMVHIRSDQKWFERNMDVLSQAESHFAIFRSIALIEAFKEYRKKVSSIVGVGEEQIKAVKRELGKMKKDDEKAGKSKRFDALKKKIRGSDPETSKDVGTLSDAEIARAEEAGVNVEALKRDIAGRSGKG